MPYCIPTDIEGVLTETELIQLTDDNIPPYQVQASVVAVAIAASGELIDGYISSRYQLPLTNCPAMLKDICVDISVYKLCMRRKKRGVAETVQKAYDNALKLLNGISTGRIQLGTTSAGVPAQTTVTDTVQVATTDRVFGPGSLEDY